MTKFNATIEYLTNQNAAIVTLTDERGDWSGSGRIEARITSRKSDLYEIGYIHASRSAACKGGTLETYRVLV